MDLFFKLSVLIGLFSVAVCISVCSQTQDDGLNLLLEEMAEQHEGLVSEDQWEYLIRLKERPLNLNAASREDLEGIFFLSPYQIEHIHYYIYRYGEMETLYELLAVEGLDVKTIKRLSLFVVVEPLDDSDKVVSVVVNSLMKQEYLLRYSGVTQELKGYQNGSFLGSPRQTLLKLKMHNDRYFLGLTYEKDIGEDFWQPNLGKPEYSSGVFEYQGDGYMEKMVLGNFRINFGQGLTLWQNSSFGKSSLATNTMKTGGAISRHSSAMEANYMNGAAFYLRKQDLDATIFFSGQRIDASHNEDHGGRFLSSFYESGYHRNDSECDKKDNTSEYGVGFRLCHSGNKLRLGFNSHALKYSIPVLTTEMNKRRYILGASSVDFLYSASKFMFWGENAIDFTGAYAGVAGLNLYPSGSFSGALVARSFSKDYHVKSSAPFSESGKANAESGLYLGAQCGLIKRLSINAYIDVFRFSAPRYGIDMPSWGIETLSALEYVLNDKTTILCRFKYQQKEKNVSDNDEYHVHTYDNFNLRFQLKSIVNDWLTIQSRVDYTGYLDGVKEDDGYLLIQDLRLKLWKHKLTLDMRFAQFFTDSYQSGIYAYESDVLYAFAVPVYYGKGLRYYCNVNFLLTPRCMLYFKIGQYKYFDRNFISSGLTEIQGSKRTDFRFQIRFKI